MQTRTPSEDEINAAYELLGFKPINGRFSHVTLKKITKAYRALALANHPDQNPGQDSGKIQAINRANEILAADLTVKVVTYLHNKFKYPSTQFAEIEPHISHIVANFRGKLKNFWTEELTSGLLIAEKQPKLKPYLGQVEFWCEILSLPNMSISDITQEDLDCFDYSRFRTALVAHLSKSVGADNFKIIEKYLAKPNVITNLMTLARHESKICSFDDSGFHFTDQLNPWLLDEKLWNLFADTGFATAKDRILPIPLNKIISALKLANEDKDNSKHTLYLNLATPTFKEISPFVSKKQEWLDLKKKLITQAIDRYFELCDQFHNSEARWEKTFDDDGDIAHIEQFFSESTFTVPVSKYLQHLSRLCISKLEKNPAAESLLNDIFMRVTSVLKDTVEKFIAAEPDRFSPIKSSHVLVHNLIDDLHEQVVDALEVQKDNDPSVIAGIKIEADKDLMALIDKERSRKRAVERFAARKPVIQPPAPVVDALALPAPEPVVALRHKPVVVASKAEPIVKVKVAADPVRTVVAAAPVDEPKEIKLDDAAPKTESTNFFARNAKKLGITTSISATAGLVIGAGITVLLALAPFTAGLTLPIAIGIGVAIFGIGTILGFVAGSIACAVREAKAAVAAPSIVAPAPVVPAPKTSAKASPEKPKPTTEPVSAPSRKTSEPKTIGSSSSARSFGGRSADPSKVGSFGGRTSVAGSFGGRSFKDGEQPVLPAASPALSTSGPR